MLQQVLLEDCVSISSIKQIGSDDNAILLVHIKFLVHRYRTGRTPYVHFPYTFTDRPVDVVHYLYTWRLKTDQTQKVNIEIG